MLHVQDVAFVCDPAETAFDDLFASVAITVEIISGELAMCNPLERDKISIFGIFKLVVNGSPWETAGLNTRTECIAGVKGPTMAQPPHCQLYSTVVA